MNQLSEAFGMTPAAFNSLVLILLLTILGIVSFQYYAYASAKNGLSFGTGSGVSLLGDQYQRR